MLQMWGSKGGTTLNYAQSILFSTRPTPKRHSFYQKLINWRCIILIDVKKAFDKTNIHYDKNAHQTKCEG